MFRHPRSMMRGRSIMPAPKKRLPKTNPALETVTVILPRRMPEGVEFVFDRKADRWVFRVRSQKGIRNLIEMCRGPHGGR